MSFKIINKHWSKLSPSHIDRAFACPASIPMSERFGEEPEPMDCTNEGLRLHKVAEDYLIDGKSMGEEDALFLDQYIQYCKNNEAKITKYEAFVNLKSVHKKTNGKIDFMSWCPKTRVLVVADLKTGSYRVTHKKDNPCSQMVFYALAAMATFKINPKLIKTAIIQPKTNKKPKEVCLTQKQLMMFFKKLLKVSHKVAELQDMEELQEHVKTGTHCRFCPAKNSCGKHLDTLGETSDLKLMFELTEEFTE